MHLDAKTLDGLLQRVEEERSVAVVAKDWRPARTFGKLMKVFGNLQENAQRVQERLATEKVTGESGGGMVTVEMNGLQRITRVTIDPKLVQEGDVAMLEDLVASAVNRAQEATQRLIRESAVGRLDLGSILGGLKGDE